MTRIADFGRRIAGVLIVAVLLGASTLAPRPVAAQDAEVDRVDGDAAVKAYWQGRYRKLRLEEAQLVQTERLATKEYADANRRTYRRSGVRHFHRTNARAARADLERVRAELASIYDEARAAGIPVFWLDEVAEEPIDMNRVQGLGVYADDGPFGGKGAYGEESDEDEADGDPIANDDGRNPLYTGEEDEPASLDEAAPKRFDYDLWLRDRPGYEQKYAPGKRLIPDVDEDDETR